MSTGSVAYENQVMHQTDSRPDSRPSFPFSHSRSNSTYSLANIAVRPTGQMRRTNSIRKSKDVIPLMLKPNEPSRDGSDRFHSARDAAMSHNRGSLAAIAPGDQSLKTQASETGINRRGRPVSMFFNRMFTPKEDEAEDQLNTYDSPNLTRPNRNSFVAGHKRPGSMSMRTSGLLYSPPSTTNNGNLSSKDMCICPSALDQAKSEARLHAKIVNLETITETKDLTISMLSEQILDKDQEIELLRSKMLILERALMGDLGSPIAMSFDNGSPILGAPGILDHASTMHGNVRNDTDSGVSSIGSDRTSRSPHRSPTRDEQHVLDTDFMGLGNESEISYDELVDENELLKSEVLRLNDVLEESANLVAVLGI